MSKGRYVIRPKADLDDQAYYYATVASPAVGHGFLVAAHDTFAPVATQPDMGWHSHVRHSALKSLRVFRVEGFESILVLHLPLLDGVEILRVVHGSRDLQALLRREGLD